MRQPRNGGQRDALAFALFNDPLALLRTLFAIGAMAFLDALYFLRSERSLDVFYSVLFSLFAFFGLSSI